MIRRIKNLLRKLIPARLFKMAQPYYHGTLALLAHYYYGTPSDQLIVIGVTGTKGKTSTAHIIYQLLSNLGAPTGLVSTAVIDNGAGEQLNWFRMTQMSGPVTHQLLADMLKAGKKCAVIEVSSEGLAQHRHYGINFDIAVFTNLTPDHIEAHGSFQAYKEAKAILFKTIGELRITNYKKVINPVVQKTIVANLDSEHGLYYLNFKADKHSTYAIENASANLVATNIQTTPTGSTFNLSFDTYHLSLPGKFNIYNVLASIAVAQSLGFEMSTMTGAVGKLRPIPGRMEVLQSEPFTVVIDYAHEKASMTALYQTVKSWPHKRIIQVFGATGGVRDKSRRTDLGTLAGKFVDIAVVTDEDPFDENPQDIIHAIADAAIAASSSSPSIGEVRRGTPKVIGQTLFRNPDRRGAIAKALSLAQPGDLVLITGKGAEQRIARANGTYENWDDRTVAREELARINK